VLHRFRSTPFAFMGCIIIVACASQMLLGAPYAVSITVTAEKTAAPGDFVTHVYTITNAGTSNDEYQLAVDLPAGWFSLGVPSSVQVSTGGSEKLFVTLVVPGTAEAGAYEAILSATSVGDTTVTAHATAHVTISPVSGIVAAWVQEPLRVQPGMATQGTFTITNTGNVADTFAIELLSSSNCDVALSRGQVLLFPGEMLEIVVTHFTSARISLFVYSGPNFYRAPRCLHCACAFIACRTSSTRRSRRQCVPLLACYRVALFRRNRFDNGKSVRRWRFGGNRHIFRIDVSDTN